MHSCTLSVFLALEIKKLVFVGKINNAYWINSFIFSLDIPLMINILYEMIKILHDNMLSAIYLYRFHNDVSEENNSLNATWSFQRTLNKWTVVRHISCQIKSSCISRLFSIASLLDGGRKKAFFKNFMDFNSLQTKMK